MNREVWMLRHGDTTWTEHERHTGAHDVRLSDNGREQARRAGELLRAVQFDRVLVSPQRRAVETCELAGVWEGAQTYDDLVEWDYGDYEGLTDGETQDRHPGWDLFRDGAPGGESPADVEHRIARVLDTISVSGAPESWLLVGHGKLLRALAARWLGEPLTLGGSLPMDPCAVSLLESSDDGPLLRLWNYTGVPPARY